MDAFGRSRRHDQIPRSLQDFARSEGLPELHIELPAGRLAADQTFHHDAVSHRFIMAVIWKRDTRPARQAGLHNSRENRLCGVTVYHQDFERQEGTLHASYRCSYHRRSAGRRASCIRQEFGVVPSLVGRRQVAKQEVAFRFIEGT
jgi:hypothetical protein